MLPKQDVINLQIVDFFLDEFLQRLHLRRPHHQSLGHIEANVLAEDEGIVPHARRQATVPDLLHFPPSKGFPPIFVVTGDL